MKSLTFSVVLASVLAAAAVPVLAQHSASPTVMVLDPSGPHVQASVATIDAHYRTLPAEQRELSILESEKLLTSSEGSAWRVAAVQAPGTCVPRKGGNAALRGKKVHLKDCREKRAFCEKATKFASKHGASSVCSELYGLTTVLLTTKVGGAK